MSSSNIARCSEDFYPLIKASHWAHVANSAFVTLMVVSERADVRVYGREGAK